MDVSVVRMQRVAQESRDVSFDRTVLRCSPDLGRKPPDLLIEERVLFKGQVRHQRSIGGAEIFGDHYFLFSAAAEDQLEEWVTPLVIGALAEHRLWKIAVHDGVFFLCRGSSREGPGEMESFLEEGQFLLSALLARSQ